jgi:hypothetical protein
LARLPYLEKHDLVPDNLDLLQRDIALNKLLIHSPGVDADRKLTHL